MRVKSLVDLNVGGVVLVEGETVDVDPDLGERLIDAGVATKVGRSKKTDDE